MQEYDMLTRFVRSIAILAFLIGTSLGAQQRAATLRIAPSLAHPLTPFSTYVPNGVGASGVARLRLSRPLHAWASVEYIRFPATTRSRPYGGSPFLFQLTTGSRMLMLTSGLAWCLCSHSWSARLDAGGGLAQVTNTSAVSGIYDLDPFARAAAFTDYTWALTGGTSLARRITNGNAPVSLELSAKLERLGPTRYLRDGPFPVGTISGVYLRPSHTATSLVTFGFGIVMQFPAGESRRR